MDWNNRAIPSPQRTTEGRACLSGARQRRVSKSHSPDSSVAPGYRLAVGNTFEYTQNGVFTGCLKQFFKTLCVSAHCGDPFAVEDSRLSIFQHISQVLLEGKSRLDSL